MDNITLKIKGCIKKILSPELVQSVGSFNNKYLKRYSRRSYSQDGVDIILANYFNWTKNGFYVDIGAHHPRRFSNTLYFYEKGWCGLNVDAMPGSMKLFNRSRKRDINLELAVSDEEGFITFYIMNEPALNSIDPSHSTVDVANRSTGSEAYYLEKEVAVESSSLEKILDRNLPSGKQITFLSVDVEGADLKVLQSNNWEKYRPICVVVECLETDFSAVNQLPIHKFLSEKGYRVIAKTLDNVVLVDDRANGV